MQTACVADDVGRTVESFLLGKLADECHKPESGTSNDAKDQNEDYCLAFGPVADASYVGV
jgi:hypothetical protein